MSEINAIATNNFILHNIDAKKLYVQEPLFTANSGDAVYVGWRPDETVLYSGDYSANNTKITLSEPVSSFDSFKIVWQLGSQTGNRYIDEYEANTKQINAQHSNSIGTQYYYFYLTFWANNTSSFDYNYTYLMNIPKNGSPTVLNNQYNEIQPIKVIGINRKENA